MESFRIDSGVKRIEVNDAGEYITIDLKNNDYFERFRQFLKWLDRKQEEVTRKAKELEEKHPRSGEERGDIDAIAAYMELQKETCDDISKQLDSLFGDGCMRKVFPDVSSPAIDLIWDFLEAVMPYLEKYAKERNESINLRYNRNRKGARSK